MRRTLRDKSMATARLAASGTPTGSPVTHGEISLNTKSATQVVVEEEDEKKWGQIKTPHHRREGTKLDLMNRLARPTEAGDKKGQLKSAMIQSMLRFKYVPIPCFFLTHLVRHVGI